jgi:hypothetical protein
MAIACLRLFTVRPEPLFSEPRFRRRIADFTVFAADFPYFAMNTSEVSGCKSHAQIGTMRRRQRVEAM